MVINAKDLFECDSCQKVEKLDRVWTTCSGAEICDACAYQLLVHSSEKVIKKLQKSSENEKIEKFYSYFESHVREELRKYNCQDKHLLRKLQPER